eukprot:4717702-Alexandrium_andersonii.AAC.1
MPIRRRLPTTSCKCSHGSPAHGHVDAPCDSVAAVPTRQSGIIHMAVRRQQSECTTMGCDTCRQVPRTTTPD